MTSKLANILSSFFSLLIAFYRAHLSGWFGGNCRFYPSCSEYAAEAYHTHSAFHASYLVVRRLLKCHPFNFSQGYDPVPMKKSFKESCL